jgi:hypothetical protein
MATDNKMIAAQLTAGIVAGMGNAHPNGAVADSLQIYQEILERLQKADEERTNAGIETFLKAT